MNQLMQMINDSNSLLIEPDLGSSVSIFVNGIWHPGIYVGNGYVIDNSKRRGGVKRITIVEFIDGNEIRYDGFIGPNTPAEIVRLAYEYIDTPYNFLLFNCKDFVRSVHGVGYKNALIKLTVVGATLFTARKLFQAK